MERINPGRSDGPIREDVYLSIVIPAYNEEERIGKTLFSIINYLKDRRFSWEIIVVDDGSRDRTREIVREFMWERRVRLIENYENRGKGYSVRQGVLATKGEFVLFSDADLSTPIEELNKLLTHLEKGYDIAIASRRLRDSEIAIPQAWIRQRMGEIFSLFIRFFLLPGLRDTQCGLKLFKGEVARKIFAISKVKGFAFDTEVLYIARRLGFKITEVPVKWYNSPESKVNPLIDSLKMLIDVCKIRMKSMNNRR